MAETGATASRNRRTLILLLAPLTILLGVLLDRIATIVWRRRKKSKNERNEQNG